MEIVAFDICELARKTLQVVRTSIMERKELRYRISIGPKVPSRLLGDPVNLSKVAAPTAALSAHALRLCMLGRDHLNVVFAVH